jgi:hypothetical protein
MKPPVLSLCALLLSGCGSKDEALPVVKTPEQAASQIDQAFANANGVARDVAAAASDAMRKGDFEKAIVSLQTVKASPDVTLDQGLAIHSTTIMLEERLISAMGSGDKNAERAYQLLKAMKRK